MNQKMFGAFVVVASLGLSNLEAVPESGKNFQNSSGVAMEHRKTSDQGNAFWRSQSAPLSGMTPLAATLYCQKLTNQERAQGILPEGYAYFPDRKADGRYVLAKESEHGLDRIPFGTAADTSGFAFSPHAPNKAPIDFRDVNQYAPGLVVACPYTGRTFRIPYVR